MKIKVLKADITSLQVDAIVNAANSYGYMGGGVAGAIKRIGGIEIEQEAAAQAPIPVGFAAVTTAGKLKCRFVIHAPTMEQPASLVDAGNVEEATRAALECADEKGLKVIAFPGMGTGVGGVPKNKAAQAMVNEIKKFKSKSLQEVILVGFDDGMVKAFKEALPS